MTRIILLVFCCLSTCIFCKEVHAQATEKIHHFEYFFDTDPGFGNANSVTVPLPAVNLSNFNFTPSVASLGTGLHNLFVRAVDSSYRWSLSTSKLFYKEAIVSQLLSNIVAAEYYLDTDPGFGNGVPVTVSSAPNVSFNIAPNIGSLTKGLHQLFVRIKNADGKWSLTSTALFYKETVVSLQVPNVVAAEYFFDTDPGFGNGISTTVTSGQNISFAINGNIASLSSGLHRLFVRTKDATGNWSQTIPELFYKETVINRPIPNVVAAEYFFDTDPGFGNGQVAAVTAGQNVTFAINGNIASLSNGLHRLLVRTKDATGKWSQTTPQLFYKETVINRPIPNVVAAEYFFDTDPGFGNGQIAAVTAGQNVTFAINGNIASLSNGLHWLYVRTKDATGNWSQTMPQLFYKETVINRPIPNVVAAEYFFDTDPGFGNGQLAAVTSGQNVTFVINGNIASLSSGLHRLHVRTKDATGNWSQTTPQLFYKEAVVNLPVPNIVAAEYYFDTDPGFGNANAFTITSPGQMISQNFMPVVSSLNKGLHRLYTRVKDATGKWSLTNTQLFYYEAIVPNPPLTDLVKLEWFWTTDPGFGNANAVTLPAGNIGQITNFMFNVPVPFAFQGTKKNFYVRLVDEDWSLTTVRVVDFTSVVLPLTLLEFTAKADSKTVLTSWTTNQEVNTDKFEVEHSTDAVTFTKIGTVAANGNSTVYKSYSLVHPDPKTGINYYRLKQFDRDGRFTYSPVVKVLFRADDKMPIAYPNPVVSILNLRVPADLVTKNLAYVINDGKAARIMHGKITGTTSEINMSNLASGIYYIILTDKSGNEVWQQIIIKQ